MKESEQRELLKENQRLKQLVARLRAGPPAGAGGTGRGNPVEPDLNFAELVDCVNSVILKMTPQGIITYINEYGLKLFGYRPEEIIGNRLLGTIIPEQESTGRDLKDFVDGLVKDPTGHSYAENENILRDGRRIWMAWTNRGVFDDQGSLRGIISVGTDITDRNQAEINRAERERWLRLMTDAVPVLIAYIDIKRRFRYFNRAFEIWLGRDASQLQDQKVEDVLGDEVYQLIKGYMDLAFSGEEVRYERDSQDSEGRPIILELVYVPHRDESGQVTGYFALGADVTADRLARQEEQKRHKLEAVIETAGAVCHRLNQPLQSLLLETEIAQEEPGQNKALKECLANIRRYTRIISGITQKLGKITDYRIEKYSEDANIIDLDKSSG